MLGNSFVVYATARLASPQSPTMSALWYTIPLHPPRPASSPSSHSRRLREFTLVDDLHVLHNVGSGFPLLLLHPAVFTRTRAKWHMKITHPHPRSYRMCMSIGTVTGHNTPCVHFQRTDFEQVVTLLTYVLQNYHTIPYQRTRIKLAN